MSKDNIPMAVSLKDASILSGISIWEIRRITRLKILRSFRAGGNRGKIIIPTEALVEYINLASANNFAANNYVNNDDVQPIKN